MNHLRGLPRMAKAAKETLGVETMNVVADKGYNLKRVLNIVGFAELMKAATVKA